ncbi:MAG: AMP-dependent synthetase and ligase [Marmoricola sp.]|nr:AMP-dependent synthetase and ligase [Marmoricola sp.]
MSGTQESPALRPGDRVALLVPGSLVYVDAVISMLVRGVVPIPLDPRLTHVERSQILADLEPARVVTEPEELSDVTSSWQPGDVPLARPMHVTSGTTGAPKGVFTGILPLDQASALLGEERDLWGFAADDVNLVLSPLYHSAPLRFAIGTLLAGGRVVTPGQFDPETATTAITAERPTTMFCVPAHLQRLFDHWDTTAWPDLTCFRLVAHAGAPCPDHLKRRLIEAFPARTTWEFYGATEGQFTACRSEEWLARPGSVGRARPGRSLSTDPDGTIWCTVPDHARFTYVNAPDKTAAAWREGADGPAFSVGDLGRLDEDGYLYLDGRREDLVITGGVNVYPAEVENALAEHPGVVDVAVYGAADEGWGQRVCAAYVGTATPAELDAWARERLSPPKRPKQYDALAEIPRTLTGKVLRRNLGQAGRLKA